MKLRRVHLHGFGQFNRGLDVTFRDDQINMVIGRNEAGKSTLLNAVFGLLFGFRDLNLGRRYEPWDDHDAYSGELTFETDDGRVLRLVRDFKTQRATIADVGGEGDPVLLFEGSADPRGTTLEDQDYFRLIGQFLGFQDEHVFRSTVFFGQQSLQTSVSDQIRRLISGSTHVDYKGVLHELHSRFAELTNENPWKGRGKSRKRLIESLQEELAGEEGDLRRGRRTLTRTVELEREIESLQQALAAAEAESRAAAESAEALEKLFALLGRQEAVRRRYDEVLGRRDQFRRYADRARELGERIERTFSHFKNVPADFPDQVRAFAADQRELKREAKELEQETARLEGLRPTPNTGLGIALAAILLFVGVLAGAVSSFGLPAGMITGIVLALVGFTAGRQLGTGYRQERAALEQRVQKLSEAIKVRKKRGAETVAAIGPAVIGRTADAVLDDYNAFTNLREEVKRVAAAAKALGDQDEVDRAFAEAGREQGAVEAALEELRARNPSLAEATDRAGVGRTLEDQRARRRTLDAGVERDRRRLEDARVELAELSARMDFDLAELQERIQEKRTRLDAYDLDRDALKLSIDVLDHCIKDFQESDVFRLSDEISQIFSRITGEKYSRVQLGASLDPVLSRGDHVPISPADLSQGARDQLYFAMRIAMARHLSRNIKLPIFLDDPFVNFDADRLRVTRGILDQIKDQHQVVMVTCDRSYAAWTENVIDLDKVRAAG